MKVSLQEKMVIERVHSWKNELHEKFMEYMAESKNLRQVNLIYHYTNLDGLLGILENQSLWASNVNFINDSQEYIYGITLYKEILALKSNASLTKEGKKICHFAEEYFLEVKQRTYCVSFCENKDLLSQWRGYSKSNVGFSIGFENDFIWGEINSSDFNLPKILLPSSAKPMKVEYRSTMIKKMIQEWIDSIRILLKEIDVSEKAPASEEIKRIICNGLSEYLPIFKNKFFSGRKRMANNFV